MKHLYLLCIALLPLLPMQAQNGIKTTLQGRIIAEATQAAVSGATVTLANQNLSTFTNAKGEFTFLLVEAGDEELIVEADGFASVIELIQIHEGQTNRMDAIALKADIAREAQEEVLLNIADQDLTDDEGMTQEQASNVSSATDVFNTLTSWAWGMLR